MLEIKAEITHTFKGHFAAIYALIEAEEKFFFSASGDKHIVKWNLESGEHSNFSVQLKAPVYALAIDKKNNLLFAGNGVGQIHVIDLINKIELKCLQIAKGILFDLLLLDDNKILIVASADGLISAINTLTFELIWSKKVTEEKVRKLSMLNDSGDFMACCGGGNLLGLSRMGNILFDIIAHQHACYTALVIEEKNLLYTGGRDAHLNVYELNSLKLLASIPAHNFAIYDLAIHPQKRLLASCSRDRTIKIWNAETAQFLLRIEVTNQGGHTHSVNRLCWSTYNESLISGGDDRLIISRKILELD